MRDRIFVSYRRSDSKSSTNAVRQTLEAEFGDAVFVDVTDIAPGAAFPDRIGTELARSAVVVAVIGPGWLAAARPDGTRRLDEPNDWVRNELAQALADPDVTVIPVLVDDALQPSAADLPEPLTDLASRNSVRLEHDTWASDWSVALDTIAEVSGISRASAQEEQPDQPSDGITQTVDKGAAIAGDNSGAITMNFGK